MRIDTDLMDVTGKKFERVKCFHVFLPLAMERFFIDIPSSEGHGIVK
jgi:hypothetical protein